MSSRLMRKDHLREVLLALWCSPRGDRHPDYFHALALVATAFGLNMDVPKDVEKSAWMLLKENEARIIE